jgi:hypothetical protein
VFFFDRAASPVFDFCPMSGFTQTIGIILI